MLIRVISRPEHEPRAVRRILQHDFAEPWVISADQRGVRVCVRQHQTGRPNLALQRLEFSPEVPCLPVRRS